MGRRRASAAHVLDAGGSAEPNNSEIAEDLGQEPEAGPSGRDSLDAASKAILPSYDQIMSLLPADLNEELIKATWRKVPLKHRNQKEKLAQQLRQSFSRWRFQLRQGCSLLFYGLGSKRHLLEKFASEALEDGGAIAFYGHQPSLTAKHVMSVLVEQMSHKPAKGCSHAELLSMIQAEPKSRRVYVLIHNIDGPGLRQKEEQLWLSRLSQVPQISLVASCDHVNAALLWDQRTAAAYKWLWYNVTNYAPYESETSQMLPVLTTIKQSATRRGAGTLLAGLVRSARDVFTTIAQWQLDDPGAPGITFAHLFRMVRERFIMSSEQALLTQLTEFRDHELIKIRAGPDGGEVMYIPMSEESLQQMLEELKNLTAQATNGGAGALQP